MGIKIKFVDGTHYIPGWMVIKSKDGDLITGDCDINWHYNKRWYKKYDMTVKIMVVKQIDRRRTTLVLAHELSHMAIDSLLPEWVSYRHWLHGKLDR